MEDAFFEGGKQRRRRRRGIENVLRFGVCIRKPGHVFLKRHVVIAVGKDHQPDALGVAVKIKTKVAAGMAEAWFVLSLRPGGFLGPFKDAYVACIRLCHFFQLRPPKGLIGT